MAPQVNYKKGDVLPVVAYRQPKLHPIVYRLGVPGDGSGRQCLKLHALACRTFRKLNKQEVLPQESLWRHSDWITGSWCFCLLEILSGLRVSFFFSKIVSASQLCLASPTPNVLEVP